MNLPQALKAQLLAHGLKPSTSRLQVLQALRASAVRHLDAESVYRQLLGGGHALGLTTVYKVLSEFEQVGLVVRREWGPGKRLYELGEASALEHGHLVCLKTRQVFEFDLDALQPALRRVARQHGLNLERVVVTAYGRPLDPKAPTHEQK